MATEGLFTLRTYEHLLHKLEWEYAQWQKDPLNAYVAWNFFVTAEHLPEWLARAGGPRLPKGFSYSKFKQEKPLLRICSHLASGGRHFSPRPTQHKSVASTRQRPRAFFEPGAFFKEGAFFEGQALMVDLTQDEQKVFSLLEASVEALHLATDVLAFWQQHLRGASSP
jgi:hypothetical protein